MFRSKNSFKSTVLELQIGIMRVMAVEERGQFDQDETLVRLLLVSPVSSAEAERCFSALKRLQHGLQQQ